MEYVAGYTKPVTVDSLGVGRQSRACTARATDDMGCLKGSLILETWRGCGITASAGSDGPAFEIFPDEQCLVLWIAIL